MLGGDLLLLLEDAAAVGPLDLGEGGERGLGGLKGEELGELCPDLPVPEGEDEGGEEGVEEGEDEEDGVGQGGEGWQEEWEGGVEVGWSPAEEDQGEGGDVHPGRPALLPPHQLAGVAHPVPERLGQGPPETWGAQGGAA